MDKKDLIVESNVLIALFKCCMEQGTTLIGELHQKPKKEFNEFMRVGWKMLNEFEKQNLTNEGYLEQISGIYHTVNLDIKEQILKTLD